MSDNNNGAISTAALTFLTGAAVGALVVALTTTRTGTDLRRDLKAMGRRLKGKAEAWGEEAGDAWETVKDQTSQAASQVVRQGEAALDKAKETASNDMAKAKY